MSQEEERGGTRTMTHRQPDNSPVAVVDPAVRAMNTIMFGLLVHFGTLWTILGPERMNLHNTDNHDHDQSSSSSSLLDLKILLLLHEYWVYLQHSNVLANPFCQRLDRQYGIALLKSNQHWAIAGTLSAYWCRETLGMFLCLPFLVSSASISSDPSTSSSSTITMTQYLILYSLIYHTIKSRGVRQDALRRYSPSFGIMRVVIDKFYVHTTPETLLTVVRLFLQGLDTWIHHVIIRDLLLNSGDDDGGNGNGATTIQYHLLLLHVLFVVWAVHAALNQYFRCSTATIMVQAWHSLTSSTTSESTSTRTNEKTKKSTGTPSSGNTTKDSTHEDQEDDDDTEVESVSSTESSQEEDPSSSTTISNGNVDHNDQDFIVRQLLDPGRVPTELTGRQGAATEGVDTAVRIETVLAILASVFILGFGTVPFRALALSPPSSSMPVLNTAPSGSSASLFGFATIAFVFWFSSLLYGIWALFLKTTTSSVRNQGSSSHEEGSIARARRRAGINILDLLLLIGTANCVFPPDDSSTSYFTSTDSNSGVTFCWYLAIGVTVKAYLQAACIQRSRLLLASMRGLEFFGKLILANQLRALLVAEQASTAHPHQDQMAWIESTLSLAFAVWVVSTPIPTPCEVKSQAIDDHHESVADVVFLGHPAELMDCWALWLLPYSLAERWQGPYWAIPLWPIHYLIGWYTCNLRRRIFGDKASFFCCDDVRYEGIRMQTWTASHFGRHFVTHPLQVKQNIEAAARHAERTGVKVLCLGALNKAESINAGGLGVVKALGPESKLSVIHGNHLTAAAVVETTLQCLGEKAKVFLTGASSKVGWAVAQALRDSHGYEVLCHSTDAGRRKFFQEQGFEAASKLSEGTKFSKLWIVGKYDLAVPNLIPQNATAVVFSVPHALGSRPDVRVVEAGTLHMSLSRLNCPRQFTNKLREHEIFACHAASAVAAYRLKRDGIQRIREIGPVDPNTMDSWLVDAKSLGFQIPKVARSSNFQNGENSHRLPVAIVGAGPSGLAVAASLARQNIPSVIFEAQDDPTEFGSWEHHFSGLEVTSQKKWCQLPGFSMSEFKGEYVTAQDYRRYLQLYAARFGLDIRRGLKVASVEKGDPKNPWKLQVRSSGPPNAEGQCPSLETFSASAVVVATGKHRTPQRNTSDDLAARLEQVDIPFVHTTDLRDDQTWSQAIQAATKGRLAIIGFGNSAADIATAILQQCPIMEDDITGNSKNKQAARIHIAARTVPPVFPRKASVLRVDTIGYFVRQLPSILEDLVIRLLWLGIPSSRTCNASFPSHLQRWSRIHGRVPVIDKYGIIASAFQSGRLMGHGPVLEAISSSSGGLTFDDSPDTKRHDTPIPIDMVLFATGYQQTDSLITREDRLNGLYQCGFGSDRFLPLQSIGEQAQTIAKQIAGDYYQT
jgi:hypothetical protein